LLIASIVDPDPHGSPLKFIHLDLECGSGFAFRRAKMTQKNRKSEEISCFVVLDVLF
jgi:hypothetical protein